MKKIIVGVFVCALLFAGCGKEESLSDKTIIDESYHSMSGESVSKLASVYVEEDGLLHIYNPSQKKSVVLCNKPDCKHEAYDENSNIDPKCNAAMNKELFFNCVPVLSGEYVYLFGQLDLSKGVVYRQKMDGSEREKLYEIDYQIQVFNGVFVQDGIAYAEANIPIVKKDNIGGVGSNNSFSVLLAITLESGDIKEISTVNKEKFHGLSLLDKVGEKIYYVSTYRKLGKKEKNYSTAIEHSNVYEYNTLTGENVQKCKEKDLEGFIVIGILNNSICAYNQKTMEAVEISMENHEIKSIYKPDKQDVLYFVFQNHLIMADMKKEEYYYLNDKQWEKLDDIVSISCVFGDYLEYFDKHNMLHVVYDESLFMEHRKELFERK